MKYELFEKVVGMRVDDVYGRQIGKAVGVYADGNAEETFIALESGNGNFNEYPSSTFVFGEETLVLMPSWKIDMDKLKKDGAIFRKRSDALDQLAKDGEIPEQAYQDLVGQYSSGTKDFKDSWAQLLESVRTRNEELKGRRTRLERFLANMKVQFKTGEIQEGPFKNASEYVSDMMKRDEKEIEDIGSVLESYGADRLEEQTD
ncbi:MAG: CdvA-like protein [Nitrososphaerales archaeon]